MLAVLDPVLFDSSLPIPQAEINEVIRILRLTRSRIPDASFYWKKLQRELIQPLSRESSREAKMALDSIRDFVKPVQFPKPPIRATVWDFRTLFSQAGEEWVTIMTRLMTGCVLSGEKTILVTRLIPGRNATEHAGPGQCQLTEKTCWNLRVLIPDNDLWRVPAVCSRRNIRVPWTTRFDDRLPADVDGARFPFCEPENWWKASIRPFETHQSRPAWTDALGNHWACPATGWGFHWDVYLTSNFEGRYGLDQLNIVRWAAPASEGATGDLHHVPREKKSRLKSTAGWSC